MNKLQKIASDISGYEHNETSARCDTYYNLPSVVEKLDFIKTFNISIPDLTEIESLKIYVFLETPRNGTDQWFHDFESLT